MQSVYLCGLAHLLIDNLVCLLPYVVVISSVAVPRRVKRLLILVSTSRTLSLSKFVVIRHHLRWIGLQILRTEVGLQLLQQDKHQCYLILFVKLLYRSLFNLLKVNMHISIIIKNIWSLSKQIVQELSHQKSSSLILFSGHIHLVLQLNVVSLKQFVFSLWPLKFLFDFFKLVFQKVNQIFICFISLQILMSHQALSFSIMASTDAHHSRLSLVGVNLFILQIFDLLLKFLNHLLTEMGSFSQFLLNFLMDLNVSLESVDLSLHFVVSEKKVFSLFTLVLQFSCQLLVLKDGKSGRGLELLIV